jgi:hypothetical protein
MYIKLPKLIALSAGACILLLWAFLHYQVSGPKANRTVAIVVPGGGLLSDGSLPSHSIARMKHAANLYNEFSSRGVDVVVITLSAGTPYKPNPVDKNGFPLYESTVGMQVLSSLGVPILKLYEEKISLDTIGNVSISVIFRNPTA